VQNSPGHERLSARLFRMEPKIRYVAVNQKGKLVEMEQSPSHPSYNPPETDRMEELIVNPVMLELAARRQSRYGWNSPCNHSLRNAISTLNALPRRTPFGRRREAG
jgi:hypothetical protein